MTRNVANQARSLEFENREVLAIIWVGFGFVQVRSRIDSRGRWIFRIRDWILKRGGGLPPGFILWLISAYHRLLGLIRPVKNQVFSLIQRYSFLFSWMAYYPVRIFFGPFIVFRPGDTVLLIDSTWGSPQMLNSLFQAQSQQGIRVVPMLHDLFPLTLPETCEERTVKYYHAWFHAVVPRADFFITNSQATGRSLERYLEQNSQIRTLPLLHDSFRLGAELDLIHSGVVDSPVFSHVWGVPGRALLAVGTIEPRKNHSFLLDAYDLLRSRGVDVSLIIIGKIGWKSEEIVKRIKSHPDLHQRLLHLSNADDRLLAEAIDRADCIVCASVDEGFGLPVVEALMRGKEVFASDIAVFREIAEERCRFFSLSDPLDLPDKVERWIEERDKPSKDGATSSFSWPDWKQSSEELIQKTILLSKRHRHLRKTLQGEAISSEERIGFQPPGTGRDETGVVGP